MKLNKYLKDLGLRWCDLPGNYDETINEYCAAIDPRNQEEEDGLCEYEFFSLDYSMALYIYPRLCRFREEYASYGTPSCFCYDRKGRHIKNGNRKWLRTLDKMILAFKYIIKKPDDVDYKKADKVITRGLALFAKYYCNLWY